MKLVEVTTPSHIREFLQIHVTCNKGNPEWIRPLDKDIEEVFNSKINKAFRHGEVIRWILVNEKNETIGRIAAFASKRYTNKGDEWPVGGFGFFECINDQTSANRLFDTAKQWLEERNMKAMDGPINFGERDKWWGLLVEGFHAPLYGMNYNPPYYQSLFENYGFQVFYNQICWYLPVAGEKQLQAKFYEAHARYAKQARVQNHSLQKASAQKICIGFLYRV
jgi:hypothetical protein